MHMGDSNTTMDTIFADGAAATVIPQRRGGGRAPQAESAMLASGIESDSGNRKLLREPGRRACSWPRTPEAPWSASSCNCTSAVPCPISSVPSTIPWPATFLVAEGYTIKDGVCSVPDAPGFGLAIDEDKFHQVKIQLDLKA